MVCDDACNKGLGLGLGMHDIPDTKNHILQNCSSPKKKEKKPCLRYDHLFPSLTLGPAEDAYDQMGPNKKNMFQQQASSSTVSESVKEEKDFVGEEVKRVSSRVSDADEEGSPRKKLKLTSEQATILEEGYKKHSTISPKQKKALAEQLNLQPRQVEVWFQNRRARTKLKQTEVDRELLKKCCEELQEENKRLQNELQELKSSGLLTPAVYMQLPAATLRVCPSCDIKIKGSSNGPSLSPYSIGQEHLSCSTFTHL